MSFNHDIFISYAHDDNYPLADGEGWVDRFHEELEAWCLRRFGKRHRIRVWRDRRRMDPNQPFDHELRSRVEQSFLFVALNSTNYAASDYCQNELKWFRQVAEQSRTGLILKETNHSRVLNVLLRNIPHAEWLSPFAGCGAFPLHDASEEGDLGDPTFPDAPEFRPQLKPLVGVIERLILAYVTPQGMSADPEPAPARPIVFIADVPDTLQTERSRLAKELERGAVAIAPRLPPPYEADAHRRQLEATLGACALAVHPLDHLAGRLVEGDTTGLSYPQVQAETALALSIPQVIWVPRPCRPEEIESENQSRLLTRLKSHPTAGKPYRFVEGRLEELLDEIRAVLADRPAVAEPEANNTQVLIDTHQEDHLFAAKLWECLETARIRCLINQERRTAAQRLNELDENLKFVDALVIIFGRVAYQWVRERLKHCLKLLASSLDDHAPVPLRNFFVFLPPGSQGTPEQLQADLPFLRLQFLDLRHANAFRTDSLQPLLQAVGALKAVAVHG